MSGPSWLRAISDTDNPNVVDIMFDHDLAAADADTVRYRRDEASTAAADRRLTSVGRGILSTALESGLVGLEVLSPRHIRAEGPPTWDTHMVINTVMAACELATGLDYEEVLLEQEQ
jgi:hypothetical protein